jgi:hypothetical protein
MKTQVQNKYKYKSLQILPFLGIDNAYVVISARKTSEKSNGVGQNLSYLYDCGNGIAVEWEPEHGPITILYECDSTHEYAIQHWFFKYTTGNGNWSQCAVDDTEIASYLAEGDYEMMFSILKRFGG